MSAKSTKKVRGNANPYQPNHWWFLSNAFTTAMNKGLLLPLGMVLVLLIFAVRIPDTEIAPFLDKLLTMIVNYRILGWVLFIVTTFVMFILIKWQRRIHTKEIQRMAGEKKKLQQELIDHNIPTSNG